MWIVLSLAGHCGQNDSFFIAFSFKVLGALLGMRATWAWKLFVGALDWFTDQCVLKWQGGEHRWNQQSRWNAEKYHLCEGSVFVLTYFHPLAERRWQRSRTLNLWWHDVTPDDAKISSETAFLLSIHEASPVHHLWPKTSHTSPPHRPGTHLLS